MTLKSINWGIIGCGDVTEIKSGPAFNRVENSKLVAVMRRNSHKARDYAERHNVAKWYDNADKLINDPDINAVYIATPPSSHCEYTKRVAMTGKPVYVEKPMSSSYEECKEMVDICKHYNVPLFVAYYRRELPVFLRVKKLLDEETIGEIRTVNVRLHLSPNKADVNKDPENWRVNPEIAGAGYFYDLASHQLDILDLFFGEISEASGLKTNQAKLYKAEDAVSASFMFKSGILGSGSWCFTASKNFEEDFMEITGSEGRISFGAFAKHPVRVNNKNGLIEYKETWPAHVHEPLIRTIVAELTGKGKCRSTGVSGARTNWAMDKILGRIWKD